MYAKGSIHVMVGVTKVALVLLFSMFEADLLMVLSKI